MIDTEVDSKAFPTKKFLKLMFFVMKKPLIWLIALGLAVPSKKYKLFLFFEPRSPRHRSQLAPIFQLKTIIITAQKKIEKIYNTQFHINYCY